MSRELRVIVAFVLLWLVSTGCLFWYASQISDNTTQIGRQDGALRVSQLRACHRLNVLRAADNRSHLKDYEVYLAVARLPRLPSSFATAVAADARGKEWVGLTHCYEAVDEPLVYAAPEPVAFAVSLPPPNALVVGPGE